MTSRIATALFIVLLMGSGPLAGQGERAYQPELLLNPFLGTEYSRWLVGPNYYLTTEAERLEFELLEDDAAAEAFVERFWSRLEAETPGVRSLFDERAVEADRRFREQGTDGRRTDRGTILVLFGEPEEISYEEFRDVLDPDVEMWSYPKKAERGLHGKKPKRRYRFAQDGDSVRFFQDDPNKASKRRLLERNRDPYGR